MVNAIERSDWSGDEAVGRGNDDQGVVLLPVAVQQGMCPGQQDGGDFFLVV